MLARISAILSVIGAVALLFASDAIIWHILPRGFERTLYDGALAFWLGLPLSLLALAFAVGSLCKNGKSTFGVGLCTWSVAVLLAFGFVYLYAAFSA
jgi:hypothetical protein